MPGLPSGTDVEIIVHIPWPQALLNAHLKTKHDGDGFKSPPVIPGCIRQARCETWTENANLTVTSLQEHRNTGRRKVSQWEQSPPKVSGSPKIPASLQRGGVPYLRKKDRFYGVFFFLTATFPWCLWSNLQKFDVCRFCQHISPECNYREACILNGRQSHSDWSSTQTSWFNNSINDFKRRSKDYSAPLSVAMCYLWDSISIMSSPYYFLLSGPKLFGLPN